MVIYGFWTKFIYDKIMKLYDFINFIYENFYYFFIYLWSLSVKRGNKERIGHGEGWIFYG
jgi:hypothetical protein